MNYSFFEVFMKIILPTVLLLYVVFNLGKHFC